MWALSGDDSDDPPCAREVNERLNAAKTRTKPVNNFGKAILGALTPNMRKWYQAKWSRLNAPLVPTDWTHRKFKMRQASIPSSPAASARFHRPSVRLAVASRCPSERPPACRDKSPQAA